MQAKLLLDQWANAKGIAEDLRLQLKFKPGKDRNGEPVAIPYFPAGTIFTGPQALFICRTGQAEPADDECANSLGMSPEKQKALQTEYMMDSMGIREDDRELFRAGVITGYDKAGKTIEYKRGPNWDAYQAAKAEAEELEDDI
tara:strand:- start:523 stop:951 length:429 start_codon:yes stop_codon:yes gene_type:complete